MQKTSKTMHLSTNGGTLAVAQRGSTRNFGNVWCHPNAITNVLSHWRVLKQAGPGNIGFDSAKANLFWVNTNGQHHEFRASLEGLHCCAPGPVPVNESAKETETHRNKAVSFFQQARLEDFQCLHSRSRMLTICLSSMMFLVVAWTDRRTLVHACVCPIVPSCACAIMHCCMHA